MYSETTHPQRFEPVEQVAQALIDYLEQTYTVERTESSVDGIRTITLTPTSAEGAAMSFHLPLPGLPGVRLNAGWRFSDVWPDCGCDACDDSVPDLLSDLEAVALSIPRGALSEWRSGPRPDEPLTTDNAGDAVGDDHVPWYIHSSLEGVNNHANNAW